MLEYGIFKFELNLPMFESNLKIKNVCFNYDDSLSYDDDYNESEAKEFD
jgi:hypothetical protein